MDRQMRLDVCVVSTKIGKAQTSGVSCNQKDANMEMINKAVYHNLQEAGMEQTQAEVVATHIPDWSQFATKQDLERSLEKLRHDIMWPLTWRMITVMAVPVSLLVLERFLPG